MKVLRKNLLLILFFVLCVAMSAFAMSTPTAKAMEESVFKMDYGAYLRLDADENGYGGLRFRVKFTDDVKERVENENVTMGFTVMTKANFDAIADKANYEYATATGEGVWQVAVDEEKIYSAKDQITDDVYNYANLLIKLSSNFENEYAVVANIAQDGAYEYADFEEGTNVKSLYYAVNRIALDVLYFEDVVSTYDWYGKDYNAYPVKIDSTNYELLAEHKDDFINAGLKVVFEKDVEDTENIKDELGAKCRYTVSFVNYDGQTSTATVLEGDSVTPATPALESLTFGGWVARDGSAMPANAVADATYYTSWEISSVDDFKAMLAAAKTASTKEGGFTGYYKLTKDLDFTGVTGVASNFMQSNSQNFAKGWQATFDGDGYALKNIPMSWQNSNGIFGEIGTNGVVKNVTIIPAYDGANAFKGYGGIVANNCAGLVENVYIKVASIVENASNAGLVRYSVKSATIRNCVVEYAGGNLATAALFVKTNGGTISNCYAVTTATFPDSASVKTKDSVISLYNTANNGLTMLTYDGANIKWGNVKVVENITLISSEQDFADMLVAAKTAGAQEGGFTGYYVLTKDLDLNDTSLTYMLSNTQNFTKGWQATFDGNGYALKNVKLGWQTSGCGLFGEIGTNGVVKNVTIIPAYSGTNTFKGYGGIVANNCAGLVENVYVKVASVQDNAANACLVRYCVKGATIRNCVVEYSGGNLASSALFVKTNGGATISNCYAVTTATFPDSALGTTKGSVAALYNTANNGLSILKVNGNDIMWGNYKIGAISA